MPERSPTFPILKWFGAAFVAVAAPFYWHAYGPMNFLQLCDAAVALTVLGWWMGSPLLLSSQAVSAILLHVLWTVDVAGQLILGRHFIGGTEYMWSYGYPLMTRLLSCFHIFWPILLLWSIRKTGFDRRALLLQAAIALALMIATLLLGPRFAPGANINYVFRDPFHNKTIGPAPIHMLLTWAVMVAALYAPTQIVLARLFPKPTTKA